MKRRGHALRRRYGHAESRPHRAITAADVGKKRFKLVGKSWRVEDFIGVIMPQDVGKLVVVIGRGPDAFVQVENDAQRSARVARHGHSHATYTHGVQTWRPYAIRVQAGGRVYDWKRFAPDREHAIRSAAEAAGREWPGYTVKVLSARETS